VESDLLESAVIREPVHKAAEVKEEVKPVTYFFAGDTLFGRGVSWKFDTLEEQDALVQRVLNLTGGAPLIVNLEGALREKCPPPRGAFDLCMEKAFTFAMIDRMNIVAVSLANNHRYDAGLDGYDEMKQMLTEAGLRVFEHGQVYDLPEFRLATFTDLDNRAVPRFGQRIEDSELDVLNELSNDKPLIAFIHWGQEYVTQMWNRERSLDTKLRERGVDTIIGSHSHSSSDMSCSEDGCTIFSLGNFIFDQPWNYTNGKVLEIEFSAGEEPKLELHNWGNPFAS